MANGNLEMIGKYLAIGAGAVIVPVFAGGVEMLSNIPMWTTAIWNGITVGGVALAAVGAGLVDKLLFSK